MSLFFTSDLHLGHQNIIKYCNRPFSSVDEMNETLIANWNSVVDTEDTVIVLGDVCMGKLDTSLPLVSRLNGHKILVLGNHDRPYKGWYTGVQKDQWVRRYTEAGFESIMDTAGWEYGDWIRHDIIVDPGIPHHGSLVQLSHTPYLGTADHDGGRTRYEQQKLRALVDHGAPLICGHVHDAFTITTTPRGTVMFNVGVDVHGFKPVSDYYVWYHIRKANTFLNILPTHTLEAQRWVMEWNLLNSAIQVQLSYGGADRRVVVEEEEDHGPGNVIMEHRVRITLTLTHPSGGHGEVSREMKTSVDLAPQNILSRMVQHALKELRPEVVAWEAEQELQ